MVVAGVDLFCLTDLGGWSSVAVLRRYAHSALDYGIKAVQLVNGIAGLVVARVAG